jgi:hypothetical protein
MEGRRRVLIIALFALTLIVGAAAVYIGLQLQEQPDVTPGETSAFGQGTIVNICGTSPPSGNWSQHDISVCANGGCSNASSSCSGPSVWVYRCNPGQDMNGIECRQNGSNVGGSATFASAFNDPCQLVQIDVFAAGQGPGSNPTDFVVWRGNNYGNCNVTPPPPPPPSGGCSYSSTQARVHRDVSQPWEQAITLTCGQSFETGSFHDGTGQFAGDTTLVVTSKRSDTKQQ